jgi:hypothetical protein
MPKRNRANELRKSGYVAPVEAVESEQARSARLFAESIRQHEQADQAKRDRKAAAIEHKHHHEELAAAKEAAAAKIRRLRETGRPHAQMQDAEAAYRAALAELTEFETGERPHWAPAPVAPAADLESTPAEEVDSAVTDVEEVTDTASEDS